MRGSLGPSANRGEAGAARAREIMGKVRGTPSAASTSDDEGQPLTLGDKMKAGAADAAKDIGKGAALGAAQGAALGGAHGAAAGALKGSLQSALGNRSVRMALGVLLVPLLLFPAVAAASTLSLTAGAALSLAQADERSSVQAVIDSGSDEDAITAARSSVSGTRIPWQIAAAITGVTGQAPDVVALELALYEVDPNSRYQDLATGAYYSSESAIRVQGDGDAAEAAQKVEDTWVEALTLAMSWGENKSQAVYKQALVWYLGQSFGSCAVGLDGAGDSGIVLDTEQLGYAKTIIGIAKSAFASESDQQQAAVIGLATAMQESTMRNLDGGDRDSVGLFQQRPSAGWGTIEQITTPEYSAGKFFQGLTDVDGWQAMAVTDAAQAVQISGFPDAYAKWETLARSLVAEHFTATEAIEIPAAVGFTAPKPADSGDTATSSSLCIGGNLTGNGVTGYPLVPGSYSITDTFGGRVEPISGLGTFHRGIDLATPGCDAVPANRAVIYAAQAGTVTKAMYWDNYGYMVEIEHTATFTTRYAHMMANTFAVEVGDEVTVGQPIGIMGTTGASTGCHLHFETFVDGVRVNPDIVMLRLGIKL
tara:strand:- start:33903 stop:35681 length:1779 start_codon:yes stop_codon:yes gene_type:complete